LRQKKVTGAQRAAQQAIVKLQLSPAGPNRLVAVVLTPPHNPTEIASAPACLAMTKEKRHCEPALLSLRAPSLVVILTLNEVKGKNLSSAPGRLGEAILGQADHTTPTEIATPVPSASDESRSSQ